MVMDQEQRELGRPSGVLAALLPSPNVMTIPTDERRMAFLKPLENDGLPSRW